ncbi:MAG: cysteine rich repeat-containing protein [Elusimicrobia bacterium]|nr:cysteine rich repeat-containing protein [Elusimicrobiota bacterium]
MNNNKLFLAALASGFALALAAPVFSAGPGGGPCAEDTAKFCKDVKPGEGRITACLKEHEKELSQACLDRKAQAKGKRQARMNKKGFKGGSCMAEYGKGFALGFRNGFKMRAGPAGGKGRKGSRAKVCAADTRKLCEDVKPGEGRVRDCLRQNIKKLSEGCKARQEKIKERLEKKNKKT